MLRANEEREKNETRRTIAISFFAACAIISLCIAVLVLGTAKKMSVSCSVASVGIISFIGVLMLANFLSKSKNLDKGELRKALTASFTSVYFALISLLTFENITPADEQIPNFITGHFTYLIGIIIIFYFGSSAVREFVNAKNSGKLS
ncbi:hypothetical protein JXJ21_07285 [candidate division KSB1 bacterium]|nr:hypothetical protein [candidate division KSB1 bacterium]